MACPARNNTPWEIEQLARRVHEVLRHNWDWNPGITQPRIDPPAQAAQQPDQPQPPDVDRNFFIHHQSPISHGTSYISRRSHTGRAHSCPLWGRPTRMISGPPPRLWALGSGVWGLALNPQPPPPPPPPRRRRGDAPPPP